eukprot:158536_1
MAVEAGREGGKHKLQWGYGLFDCYYDCDCCAMFFLPCVALGDAYNKVGAGPFCFPCCSSLMCCCLYPCVCGYYRKKFREKFQLEGTIANDIKTMCFCPCCGVVQMDNEASHRGYAYGGNNSVPTPAIASGKVRKDDAFLNYGDDVQD